MNFFYLLAAEVVDAIDTSVRAPLAVNIFKVSETPGHYSAIDEIAIFLNQYIIPFSITLSVMGAIMAIILGAAIVRADDLKKAAEYKKKLIGMVVTIFIVIFLVWILGWLITSWETIIDFFKSGISF